MSFNPDAFQSTMAPSSEENGVQQLKRLESIYAHALISWLTGVRFSRHAGTCSH